MRHAPDTGNASGQLQARRICRNFGAVQALHEVSVSVAQGSIVGLIGPNGSGKTTLINCISGVLPVSAGSIDVDGRSMVGWETSKIAASGVVRTFQNIRLFGRLTCRENIEAAAVAAPRVSRGRSREHARALLRELGLLHLEHRYAGTLSYGDQRRLEIARALATAPRFLLLDEPAAGMNEEETAALAERITWIRSRHGCGIIVIEHDLKLILGITEYVYVLNEGKLICEGVPEVVSKDPAVISAYIGEDVEPGE